MARIEYWHYLLSTFSCGYSTCVRSPLPVNLRPDTRRHPISSHHSLLLPRDSIPVEDNEKSSKGKIRISVVYFPPQSSLESTPLSDGEKQPSTFSLRCNIDKAIPPPNIYSLGPFSERYGPLRDEFLRKVQQARDNAHNPTEVHSEDGQGHL